MAESNREAITVVTSRESLNALLNKVATPRFLTETHLSGLP